MIIMRSMEQSSNSGGLCMGEKQYKTMSASGVASLVAGIVMIIAGISAGVVAIVSGARLLSVKKSITF